MFYLNHFFKILAKNPLRFVSFFTFTFLLTVSIFHRNYFEARLVKLVPEEQAGPYFYALVNSDESYYDMARKIQVLPGVMKVDVLTEEKIQSQMKEILTSYNLDVPTQILGMSYAGLKVVFSKDLRPKSQELIRDYLAKLSPTDGVVLGQTRQLDSGVIKRSEFISQFKNWGIYVFYVLVGIFWLISLNSFRQVLSEKAYILENFQRKSGIGVKLGLLATTICFGLSIAVSLLFGAPYLINSIFIIGLFIVSTMAFLKKYQWVSR